MHDVWLQTNNLSRHYRRGTHTVRALDDVSIDIARGEFVSVVGASGSGKSTLLNLLAGLDTPTSGEIVFEGTPLNTLNRRQLASYRAHRVGMIFQAFNLMPHRTAEENVALAMYFNNTPRRERIRHSKELLEQLGMADRLDHYPRDLSGGEQQRVAIARALVKKPDIILADEPTGNLDLENTLEIARLLRQLNDQGMTIVMVTHDAELANDNSDRVIRMEYGKVRT